MSILNLYLTVKNNMNMILFPFKEDEFFFFVEDLDIYMKFYCDDSNTITHAVSYESGYEYKGIKLPD